MVVLSLFVVWCISFCFVFFFFVTRTSRLAPMARTLLGGLGHAMFNFFVVAARLFLVFCVCLHFDDLAKQWRKILGGVSEVVKNDFSVYFCRMCVFFLVLYFSLLRSRATSPPPPHLWPANRFHSCWKEFHEGSLGYTTPLDTEVEVSCPYQVMKLRYVNEHIAN